MDQAGGLARGRAGSRPFQPALPVAFLLACVLGGVSTTPAAAAPCTRNTPYLTVQNNWDWASSGSWGLPGQQLAYELQIVNYDAGCGSSTLAISVSAPSGFSVAIPTSTISLGSGSSGYLWAYVTAPMAIAEGTYPLIASVARAGTSTATASETTYYKVYSSDSTAPTLFWPNPWDGAALSGNSYSVNVTSRDDHAVRRIEVYIDNNYVSTTNCDGITYTCQLTYKWQLRRVRGQHTITFKSYDWLGNVGVLPVTFTVS